MPEESRRGFLKNIGMAARLGAVGVEGRAGDTRSLPFDEYTKHDGIGLAELVRQRQVSPEELLGAAIARAEAVNPQIKAIVVNLYDRARKQIAVGLPEGPFKGVPFLVKDLGFWMKGAEWPDGSRLYRGHTPTKNDTVIDRLEKSGLVIFGRTHVSEFGLVATSESALHGVTRNPWALDRIAGGSSGGTAAAVAAGIVPFGSASDGGGSIRIPASCCGLFGLKPTRCRVPLGPDSFEMWEGLEVAHAITRTVRDSCGLLDVACGPAPGDGYCAPGTKRPFLEEISIRPEKLRIALVRSFSQTDNVHPECAKAVVVAEGICRSLRHDVEDATRLFQQTIPIQRLSEAFGTVWCVSAQVAIRRRLECLGRELAR